MRTTSWSGSLGGPGGCAAGVCVGSGGGDACCEGCCAFRFSKSENSNSVDIHGRLIICRSLDKETQGWESTSSLCGVRQLWTTYNSCTFCHISGSTGIPSAKFCFLISKVRSPG